MVKALGNILESRYGEYVSFAGKTIDTKQIA